MKADKPQIDLSGLSTLQEPVMIPFAPLTCELLFCSTAKLGKWIGAAQPIPTAQGAMAVMDWNNFLSFGTSQPGGLRAAQVFYLQRVTLL